MWAATLVGVVKKDGRVISIHAARVGSDMNEEFENQLVGISIHAARVGSDRQ